MLNFYKDNFMMFADLFKAKGSSAYIAGWEKHKPQYDHATICRDFGERTCPVKPWLLRIVRHKDMSEE